MQPIVPPPVTSTVSPSTGPARWMACRPIDSGSAQAISPSVMWSSVTGVSCRSAITKRSRNMPWACGKTLALPRKNIFRHRLPRPAAQ